MDVDVLMKGIGALGLLGISGGVLLQNERKQDWLFIAGGVGLLAYSLYLKDPIFVPLQIIFMATAAWELWHTRTRRSRPRR